MPPGKLLRHPSCDIQEGYTERMIHVGSPEVCMQILDEIDAAIFDVRKQTLIAYDLLANGVTAIVDDDVERSALVRDVLQELGVALIPDEDLRTIGTEPGAIRVNIDAGNGGLWSKVLAPKRKASPLRYPDLKQ